MKNTGVMFQKPLKTINSGISEYVALRNPFQALNRWEDIQNFYKKCFQG